jgi:Tfp pilus assembly protein PilF
VKPRSIATTCGLLVILTLVGYAPVLKNGFTNYDDDTYVSENRHVQHGLDGETIRWAFTTTRAANWHPLTWLSHTLDWSLYGGNPLGHHLTSLVFHAANVVILFLLLGSMTGAWGPSAFAAALFAIHPLHVESVAWIAERKDVLSTLFWLLATWAYVRYARSPSVARMGAVTALMVFGLLAKPMLVTLPFTLLLLDYWPLHRDDKGWRRLVVEKWPLFLLTAASCGGTYLAQSAGGAVASTGRFTLPARFANAVWSYAAYLIKTIWPTNLAAFYPHPGETIPGLGIALAALALAGVTALAYRWRRSRPYLLVGWLWYLGTLVPVIGLVQVGKQGMADRYTYVPLIGVFIVVAWATSTMRRRTVPAAIAIVLALAALTRAQATVWRDSINLFEHALAVTGGNPTAFVNLGSAYEAAGRIAEATTQYDDALRLDPANRAANNRMAGLLARQGRLDEAVVRYLVVLARNPADAETLDNLGVAFAKQRRFTDAIARFNAALETHPEDPAPILTNLGNALLLSGRRAEAIEKYREALRLNPGDAETEANLRVALGK